MKPLMRRTVINYVGIWTVFPKLCVPNKLFVEKNDWRKEGIKGVRDEWGRGRGTVTDVHLSEVLDSVPGAFPHPVLGVRPAGPDWKAMINDRLVVLHSCWKGLSQGHSYLVSIRGRDDGKQALSWAELLALWKIVMRIWSDLDKWDEWSLQNWTKLWRQIRMTLIKKMGRWGRRHDCWGAKSTAKPSATAGWT